MEYYLTAERLEELKKELNELKLEKRLEVANRLKRAKELGDLSENSEYFEARQEQEQVEYRILELEQMIKNASLIKKSDSSDMVRIGSMVEVKRGTAVNQFRIVGSNEVKPEEGLISNESPLGKGFLGKKVGDIVKVKVPSGEVTYEILKIS
jgi:transcription elongation factor GreA